MPLVNEQNKSTIIPLEPHIETPTCFELELQVNNQKNFVDQLKGSVAEMNKTLDSKISAYKLENPNKQFWDDQEVQNKPENKKLIDTLDIAVPLLNAEQKIAKNLHKELSTLKLLRELGLNPLMCKPDLTT